MQPLMGQTPDALHLDELKPWNSARQMLVCLSVADEAPDVKTFTFAVEGGGWFRYAPGQFITVELRAKGGDLHRTYTISSTPSRPYAISITVKAQPGSIGTRWMFDNIKPGSRMRAYGPSGHFTLTRPLQQKYLFVSAGSGVTPMMSMLRWLADCAPMTDVTFLNASRRPEDIIFRAELELLATRMPNLRLGFIPEMSSPAQPWAGLTGRIDRTKLQLLAPDFLARETFCCGPDPFMKALSGLLRSEGFDMGHYHQESFGLAPNLANTPAQPASKTPPQPSPQGGGRVTAVPPSVSPLVGEMAGRPEGVFSGTITIDFLSTGEFVTCESGDTVLKAARSAHVRIPAACESGLCGTCKVKKRSGDVEMHHNGGITTREIDEGYILACCSRPLTALEIEA
ncbi:hybrid-cluster NAD(P)-dependent oxidoreductase [Rhizobium sp. C4]|uniref:hybrid-cluster NAD(P)-dependent oxidoreductase n=1 Tax=Rhizobium sp. C4 TaxID=1349800 RepID=UPI001E65C55A|nr:hybrid-cluster NAD(P)-dependent oxidoreductase [Rhizobium sp. C4]MCD2175619.1 hybrid-cluster NAD(P)-dependent oxidoreductase [Rhizobium sp. C4]